MRRCTYEDWDSFPKPAKFEQAKFDQSRASKAHFCISKTDFDNKPFWNEYKSNIFGTFESNDFRSLGVKIKANPKSNLKEVKKYVAGLGNSFNIMEMLVTKTNFDATKYYGQELDV
jgi:hypothetical protein